MAESQNILADGLVAAVVKVDAEHPDQLAVLLDKQRGGAQCFASGGNAWIMQPVILRFIASVHQDLERNIGQRCADLPTAHMVVGNRDDRTVFVGQVMQCNLIVRAESLPKKLGQFDVMLQ